MNQMTLPPVLQQVYQMFESIKQYQPNGFECWSARDLQPRLGYTEWRKFVGVIQRAMNACHSSGYATHDHFVGADKMVQLGDGAIREIEDFLLSRYACYLVAQNGDSRKPEIGIAQTYFALNTRMNELNQQQVEDIQRLSNRIDYTTANYNAIETLKNKYGIDVQVIGKHRVKASLMLSRGRFTFT